MISGPSGVGKDAVISRMKHSGYPLKFVVTLTTRQRRSHERDGVDYHFVKDVDFQELVKTNGLLEYARVYGNWYGVPAQDVKEALAEGQDVLVKVDVQGAETIKKNMPQAVAIFLAPPSRNDLLARLNGRQTESAADLAVRVQAAEDELNRLHLFDYVVFSHSNEIDRAVSDIQAIILTEKFRPPSG